MSTTSDPLVSIIVPVYNAERYLDHCLHSIQEQTYRQLQVILIDDGSTDKSADICRGYVRADSRFTLIQQDNGGIGKAQNRGLDAARGAYIAFVDNDDILDTRNIELLLEAILKTDADMSKARWQQFGPSQLHDIVRLSSVGTHNPQTVTVFQNPLLAYQNIFCKSLRLLGSHLGRQTEAQYFNEANWCRLYRAQLWEGVRFPEGAYAQDVMVAGQLYQRMTRVADIDLPLYFWLQTPSSVTHTKRDPSFFHDNIAAGMLNFQLALDAGIRPARSCYTMIEGLHSLKAAVQESSNEIDLYQQDKAGVQRLLRKLPAHQLVACLCLSALRYGEKLVYDARIKNMT